MKTFLLTATYLVGIGELILAIFFWVTHSKNEIRKVMALLAFSTGMWVITSAIVSFADANQFVFFVLSLVYFFGVILMTALLHLALLFPYPLLRLDRLHAWLLYVPAIIFSFIAISTKTIVADYIVNVHISGNVVSGPLHALYNFYLLLLFILSLAIFLYRIRKTDGIHKRNLSIVFWSVLIGGSIPVWLDLIIPIVSHGLYDQSNYLIGNIATVIWLGATTYIITKK